MIARLRPKLAEVEGGAAVPAGGAGHPRRRAAVQDAVSVHAAGRRRRRAVSPGRRRCWRQLQKLPKLRDVATDQQIGGTTATLTIDRDAAARFGIQPQAIDDTLYDAFGQRQITQYFTQLNSYHVILEVLPDAGRATLATLRQALREVSDRRQAVPLSTFVKVDTTPVQPLSVSHQSQFPAVTISFNLAPGVALGEAVDGDRGGDDARWARR